MVARLPAYPPTRGARRPSARHPPAGMPPGNGPLFGRWLRWIFIGSAPGASDSAGAPLLMSKAVGKPPGAHGGGGLYGQGKNQPRIAARRRCKFQIIRFAASGKAHSFHCALAPVAALRFPGQTGPPIAPLLFPGSLYPPLAALRRETLPTEPASLGFGGDPERASPQAPYPSLPPYGESSLISLCLLSPQNL